MKFISRFLSIILAVIVVSSFSISAYGAEVEISDTGRNAPVTAVAQNRQITGTKLTTKTALPAAYSSRELSYTTPVRNQYYNDCWAFGALATLESTLLKDGISTEHFSVSHANFWGTLRDDNTGWNRTYTQGGYSYISLGYLTSWQGPLMDVDFPYFSDKDDYDALSDVTKQVSVNGIIYLDTRDIETVKTAVYNYGAALGNYHVNDSYYNSDTYAYFCNIKGLTTSQLYGHAISIVGWDDNFKKENFNSFAQPENDGAWLCKNSWGDSWGDSGYYWISYEDEYLFDTRFGHSYAFNDYHVYDKTKTIYQNEIDGATYEFEYIANKDVITYINVFDTDKEYDTIEKVNFETVSQGAYYTVYNIPLDENNIPKKDINKWKAIGSGFVPYQGYISVDTEDFTVTEDKFAIGIELIDYMGSNNTIGVSEWLTSGGTKIFTPQSQKGMSYIHIDGHIEDALDFYKNSLDDDIGATFVIKAVAKEKEYEIGDVDLDGTVSVIDATAIQRHIAQIEILSEKQLKYADFDSDKVISIMDATQVQFKIAGYNTPDDDGFEEIEDL